MAWKDYANPSEKKANARLIIANEGGVM